MLVVGVHYCMDVFVGYGCAQGCIVGIIQACTGLNYGVRDSACATLIYVYRCMCYACIIYDIRHALRYVYALIYYLGCANVDDGTHNLNRFSYCCAFIILYWCITTLFFIPILNLTDSRPRAQTLTIPYNQISRPAPLAPHASPPHSPVVFKLSRADVEVLFNNFARHQKYRLVQHDYTGP